MASLPKYCVIFAALLFLTGAAPVEAADANQVFTVDGSDFSSIDLTFSLDDLESDSFAAGGKEFSLISIGDYGFTRTIGAPRLPVVREFVEIPHGASYKLVLSDLVFDERALGALGLDNPIAPAQAPRSKGSKAHRFEIDEALYATDAYVISETARLGEELIARGRRLVVLELFPVNYNPLLATVKILKSASITIELTGSDEAKTRETLLMRSSSGVSDLMSRVVLNGSAFETPILSRPNGGGSRAPVYLMISAPTYASNSNLQLLKTLRAAEGFDVSLVDTNTTGSSASAIKAYIQNVYDTQDLQYVVLVGDTNTIPSWTGGGSSSPDTDLNYVCVDGSDYFPDVARGRLSVRSSAELDNLCTKILDMAGLQVREAVFMAGYDNYNISEGTHNYCISNFLDPQGWVSDKLYQVTYGANTQDVKNSFNDGRSVGCFSGHGSSTSWADGPPFSQSDVRSLVNTVYPFVMSFACSTGDYDYYNECFTETWVRDDHGATSCFGASLSSYWDEDDILQKEIFEGWYNGLSRVGDMLDFGQYELYLWMGAGSFTQMYYEMYNLMGDPAIEVIPSTAPTWPVCSIQVDGGDGPISIPSTQVIDLTISIDPRDELGNTYDWWIFGDYNPWMSYWWQYPGWWKKSAWSKRSYIGPLVELNDYLIAHSTVPVGNWLFHFCVDAPDNVLQETYGDTISVSSY